MKRTCALLLALAGCAGVGSASAADVAAGFDAANKLYEQGKFAEASAAYQDLVQAGQVSPALFFNLGNACFKAGEIGRAITAYGQAQRLAPRDPDVRVNLQFVRNQVQGPTLQPDRWERALRRLTLNEWTVLTAVPLWFCLLSLAAIQFRPAWKPALRGLIWISGLATVAFGAVLAAALSMSAAPTAIVTAREAAVHNGPLDESPGAFKVHDGAELEVVDRKDDWIQVAAGDRQIGWLKRDQVILVPRN